MIDSNQLSGTAYVSRLELEPSGGEAQEATRNLVLMLASLATCGFVELRPASVGSLFHIAGFTIPQPSARGEKAWIAGWMWSSGYLLGCQTIIFFEIESSRNQNV